MEQQSGTKVFLLKNQLKIKVSSSDCFFKGNISLVFWIQFKGNKLSAFISARARDGFSSSNQPNLDISIMPG